MLVERPRLYKDKPVSMSAYLLPDSLYMYTYVGGMGLYTGYISVDEQ